METIEKLKKQIEYRDKQIETLSGTISKSMGVNTRPAHRFEIGDHWVLVDPKMDDEMFERMRNAVDINSDIIHKGEQKINYDSLCLLIARLDFDGTTDYDKDQPTDKYHSLKIVTWKKKLVGNLEMYITFTYKFVEAPDTFNHTGTIIELVQGTEFQEIKFDSIAKLDLLIKLLGGYENA